MERSQIPASDGRHNTNEDGRNSVDAGRLQITPFGDVLKVCFGGCVGPQSSISNGLGFEVDLV